MTALHDRVEHGNPPAAAQLKGVAVQQWARQGVLASLDEVARLQSWDAQLPSVVSELMKYEGHYVAAPVNVHRVNWLWINANAMRKVGGRAPRTWEQFFALADRMKAAGILPLATGDQSWQDFTIFEVVVLSVGGPDFYRDALIGLDGGSLNSTTMARVLTILRRLRGYTDLPLNAGRDWNAATAMVIQGEAGMQLMGDWAKGEFLAAGTEQGRDFLCVPVPGTDQGFVFNIDSIATFRLKGRSAAEGQRALVLTIMDPSFQITFNLNKGSIPAVRDADLRRFDRCGQESGAQFLAASARKSLVPSIAHRMVQSDEVEKALREAVSAFWNDSSISIQEAMNSFLRVGR